LGGSGALDYFIVRWGSRWRWRRWRRRRTYHGRGNWRLGLEDGLLNMDDWNFDRLLDHVIMRLSLDNRCSVVAVRAGCFCCATTTTDLRAGICRRLLCNGRLGCRSPRTSTTTGCRSRLLDARTLLPLPPRAYARNLIVGEGR
jgi:hypothetical protein